jgi:hypothetical protein
MKLSFTCLLVLTAFACRKSVTKNEPFTGRWIESSQRLDTLYFNEACESCFAMTHFFVGSTAEQYPGVGKHILYYYSLRNDSLVTQPAHMSKVAEAYRIYKKDDKQLLVDNFLRPSLPAIINFMPLP